MAGFETTVNLIGGSGPAVVEEALRHDPPVRYTVRVPDESTRAGGTPVPEGAPVVLLPAGANRDPAVFADPHRFDPDRPDVREHLSFSSGIHYRLGAGPARMEGAAARGPFRRFPDLKAGPVRRRPSRVIPRRGQAPVTTGAGGRRPVGQTTD